MPQARRKRKLTKTTKRSVPKQSMHDVGMLMAGIVVGALGMYMTQGYFENSQGVGSGIRNMIEQSKQQAQLENSTSSEKTETPVKQKTTYDFFTILPEIEVLVPEATKKEQPKKSVSMVEKSTKVNGNGPVNTETKKSVKDTHYMLQAGSYKNRADAESRRATLALNGLKSRIQTVSIQGKGNFHRVRLGPYESYQKMTKIDTQLSGLGVETLRLKVSSGG